MENSATAIKDDAGKSVTRLRPRECDFRDPAGSVRPANASHRDWSKALRIIDQVADALATAETQARHADEYSRKLEAFHKDQMELANDRAAAAEQRAETLALQLEEAEGWLVKLSDALYSRFQHLNGLKDAAAA